VYRITKYLRNKLAQINERKKYWRRKSKTEGEQHMEKQKKEWTIGKLIIRLIAYPFCLFIIFLGVYMIGTASTWKSVLSGAVSIGIALVYLYSDVTILMQKGKEEETAD
jgi:hypothetical protein